MGYENLILFENPDFDDAIIGTSHNGRVVYDFDKMVECLAKEENMTVEEAMDFICYNTIRSIPYMGSDAPIVLYPLYDIN